jgi:hypothetical protein
LQSCQCQGTTLRQNQNQSGRSPALILPASPAAATVRLASAARPNPCPCPCPTLLLLLILLSCSGRCQHRCLTRLLVPRLMMTRDSRDRTSSGHCCTCLRRCATLPLPLPLPIPEGTVSQGAAAAVVDRRYSRARTGLRFCLLLPHPHQRQQARPHLGSPDSGTRPSSAACLLLGVGALGQV